MILATMSWPEAVVASVSVVMLGVVLSVGIWQIFRTGQTAIRKEGRQHGDDGLRAEVDALRAQMQHLATGAE